MDQVFTAARNTRLFFIYRAVSRLYFYLPVLVLYFFVQGESFFKIGVLLCVYSLSVMVFEQPTSKWIEHFGAKRIIIFGEVLKACGLTLLVYAEQTSYSIIAQLLTGAGYALAAGGDASLMSRSLVDAEQQAKVQKKAHVIVLVCVITASVVGGVVAQLFGARTALLISIVPPLLAVLSACFFIEPYTGKGPSSLTCRAGLETLAIIEADGLLEHALGLGAMMVQQLRDKLADLPQVVQIRGLGLMIGITLDRPCQPLVAEAMREGLLINVTAERVVRLLPPLVLSREEASAGIATLTRLIRNRIQDSGGDSRAAASIGAPANDGR